MRGELCDLVNPRQGGQKISTNFRSQRHAMICIMFAVLATTTSYMPSISRARFHTTSRLYLNRLLFTLDEYDIATNTATLPISDKRAVHVIDILKLDASDTVKAGVVSTGLFNSATIG